METFNADFKSVEPILPDKAPMTAEEFEKLPEKKKVEIMGLI